VGAERAEEHTSEPLRPAAATTRDGAGRLALWIAVPALVALAIAGLVTQLFAAAPAPAAVVLPPSVTASPVGSGSAADVGLASPTALPTATPDAQALAVLTQLPAVLPTETPAPPTPPPVPPTEPPAPPTTAPVPPTAVVDSGPTDPITGLPIDAAKLNRAPLVVMIDNHPDAAPQTGLNDADMVFEALAEGGITRFETFFLSGDAPTVGPVRSARPYYVEWAYPFKPLYVHCGGSWEAIDLINEAQGLLKDVDCFNGSMPFWRSNDRLMPHNLYSSTTQLWKLADRLGLHAPANMPGFLHSAPLPADQRPAGASVSWTFSSLSRSDVTWVYDHDSNRYLRKQWGYWHKDAVSGETISAANVVLLWTDVWELPGDEKGRMGTDTIGGDTALILRDGQFEWGYWERKTTNDPLVILDGKREPMRFAPGRIWVEALGVGKKVQIGH
jgi:hypothetical protein